ncbi:RIP metalloprotease RseP [Synechococcus sp. PCC 7336]|uniref:RIP metalloprotease RseP n=1 Tax=Synechococcus sp. PCC 7336 TaxID=195250 RepID=UPI00034A92E5|nr:RIP metalloprotease RseP [Synechococcus sp. PCC 7336]
MFVFASIGILALLILVHEAGHFAAARLQGIHANRFSIGFGPIVWSYEGKQTEYALRALPLGGFVGFPDDDPDCPFPPDDPDLLRNRPVLDRAVVMSAGVLSNLVFAYIVLLVMVVTLGVPTPAQFNPGIILPDVAAEGPAQVAGVQPGDVILQVNDLDLRRIEDEEAAEEAIGEFQAIVRESNGQPVQVEVQRFGQTEVETLVVTPEIPAGGSNPVIGVTLAPNQEIVFQRPDGIGPMLAASGAAYQRIVTLNLRGFAQLLGNFQNTAGQIAGPVGIVKIGADLARDDSASLFNFAALISINLAIINILPLPALDGGHLMFLAIEAVRGRRLPKAIEDRVMQTGLLLLLGLGVVLILKDTASLVTGAG